MQEHEKVQSDEQYTEVEFGHEPIQPEFIRVSPGTYLCRVDEARYGVTRNGNPRWGLKFVVDQGNDFGRMAAWDGLVFSPKAQARTRQVLAALGLPHMGTVRFYAADFLGKRAWVTVVEESYTHPETGRISIQMKVPYEGIRPCDAESADAESADAESGDAEKGDAGQSTWDSQDPTDAAESME